MGYVREKLNTVFEARAFRSWNTSNDEEIMPYIIVVDATATDAKSFTYALKDKVRVIDAWIIPVVASGGGTCQIQDNDGNAITDAMACATNKALARAAEIDDANYEEAKGNNLKVVQNGNADSCWAFILVVPVK
jgi:hypothetical protein